MCSPVTSTPKRSGHKCMSCEGNISDITNNDAYKTANDKSCNGQMSEPRMEICFEVTPGDPNISHYLNVLADLQPVLYRGRNHMYCNTPPNPSCDSSTMNSQRQAVENCGQAGAVFNVYQSPRSATPAVQQSPGFRIYEDSTPGAVGGRSHAGAGFQIFQDSPSSSTGGSSKCPPAGHPPGGTVLSAVGIGTAAGAAGRSFRIFEDDPSPNAHRRQLDIKIRHNKQAAADFLGNNAHKRKPFGNKACGPKVHNPYVLPQVYPKCPKHDSIKKTPCRRVTAQGRRLRMNSRSPCSGKKTHKSKSKQKRRHGKDQITKNPFFNYLRDYRRKNCNKSIIEAAVEGAKIWKCMSLDEKCPYKIMAKQHRTK